MFEQVMGLLGALLILIAYMLTVERPEKRRLYFSLSLAGGVALLIVALIYSNFGLIFLETAWIAINLRGLWKAHRQGMHAAG
ncbi:MAG: hypothetical protein R8K53_06735 [Mariprofundaceae bacterium]